MLMLGFLGIPSLHDIIEAIANGFFGALASALVPSFLKHATVATIQHLVALPDPATWPHVGQLQQNMIWLGVALTPVTLTLGTLRYWLTGLTGQAHPVLAVGRCSWATGVLVGYRWLVEQVVAATNTLTHAILGFPSVSDGLTRIVTVLFGGALLTGAGGVFGAFLVIIGVIFAAALFAVQVLLTVVLALLVVAGPPLIAISAVPELSHLARGWGSALLSVSLVPLAWTVLFATAGALSLDATSFTGAAGGLPGHVAAAFAGLITFVLAVRLPMMLLGQSRQLLGGAITHGNGHTGVRATSSVPGVQRVREGHARLRSVALVGVPSLGRSAGRAAGALGAPTGGPLGALRRRASNGGARRRSREVPATGDSVRDRAPAERPGWRGRVARAAQIIRAAPLDARTASRRAAPASRARPAAPARPREADQSRTARPTAPSRRGKGRERDGVTSTTRPGATPKVQVSSTAPRPVPRPATSQPSAPDTPQRRLAARVESSTHAGRAIAKSPSGARPSLTRAESAPGRRKQRPATPPASPPRPAHRATRPTRPSNRKPKPGGSR